MEAKAGITLFRDFRAGNHDRRTTVAAHGIKRDDGTADHWFSTASG
jgi:hypothetical protein